jgi:hypothetical protein
MFEGLNVEEREVESSKLEARRRQKGRGEGAAGGGAFRAGWAGERGGERSCHTVSLISIFVKY